MCRRKPRIRYAILAHRIEGCGFTVVSWRAERIVNAVTYYLLGGASVTIYSNGGFFSPNKEVEAVLRQHMGYRYTTEHTTDVSV